jgi:hypothetical protein
VVAANSVQRSEINGQDEMISNAHEYSSFIWHTMLVHKEDAIQLANRRTPFIHRDLRLQAHAAVAAKPAGRQSHQAISIKTEKSHCSAFCLAS